MHPLHTLAPSLGASLGVPIGPVQADFGEARHVVVVLIDGLGWVALQEHLGLTPALAQGVMDPWCADLPTTTPTGLAALGTALDTGQHGFVGASFLLPETGDLLTPLHWPADIPPPMVQPEPTIFERLDRGGVAVWSLGPAAYARSGLTDAVLRGGRYVGVHTVAEYAAALRDIHLEGQASFTYVYWPDLDRIGHRHGVDSDAWREGLRQVDTLIAGLIRSADPQTLIVVTADHGMVDVRPQDRVEIDDVLALRGVLQAVGGEPRFRHIYLDGEAASIAEACRAQLGDAFTIMTRQEVIEGHLLGVVDPALGDRIGDLVVMAKERWILASSGDRRVSGFIGQHGSNTPAEQLIPAVRIRP